MTKKLTAAGVRSAAPGKHYDLHGLFLMVLPSGARCWVWRGTVGGKRVDLGLGGFPYTSLAEAREAAYQYRKLARQGEDPRTLRGGRSVPKFAEACERVIRLHEPTWKGGGRTAESWRATLRDYALPRLADKRVDEISTADVLAVLTPIWHAKPTTAERVRVRIGAVMKWAIAEGYRPDNNPAGDSITAALPRSNGRTRHHRAAAHANMADVLAKVRESGAWAGTKLALELVALTATRPAEVCGMRWAEIAGATWQIPAERMKTGKEHRVALSRQALRLLDEAGALSGGGADELVFPSARGKLQATRLLLRLLTDLGTGTTTHGTRAAFRSWCADSGVDRGAAEAALAHIVGGIEGSYQRSDLIELRREVMQRWADYIMP